MVKSSGDVLNYEMSWADWLNGDEIETSTWFIAYPPPGTGDTGCLSIDFDVNTSRSLPKKRESPCGAVTLEPRMSPVLDGQRRAALDDDVQRRHDSRSRSRLAGRWGAAAAHAHIIGDYCPTSRQ